MYVSWQVFSTNDSPANILASSQGLMQNSGWQIINSYANNNGMVIGGLNGAGNALVQVTASATNVIVTAYAEDTNTAERDRDFIVRSIRPNLANA